MFDMWFWHNIDACIIYWIINKYNLQYLFAFLIQNILDACITYWVINTIR